MGIGDWFKGLLKREEDFPENLFNCDKCGFQFPESSLVTAGAYMLCSDCNEKRKKEIAELEFKKRQAVALQKIKYYCYDCKFHFSRKKDFSIKLCPNCSSENFVPENTIA